MLKKRERKREGERERERERERQYTGRDKEKREGDAGSIMGNMAYRALALSQADVEELCEVHCAGRFRQSEVEALFKRFRDLDRDHKV